jgi:hypothetical protein
VKSRPWPGGANLEISEIWLRRGVWGGRPWLDGTAVPAITTSLDPRGRISGSAHRLKENAGKSFQGSIVLGLGFTMSPEEARALIQRDPKNEEVLLPYLNGEDLNSSPDQSPSRWVINFHDWPLEKAAQYRDCMAIVREKVKPVRDRNNRQARRERWWQYAERAPGLYRTIGGMQRVLVIARISRTAAVVVVPTSWLPNEKVVVFAYQDHARFGLLSSSIHLVWALQHSTTLRTDLQYTPSDCFDTFPQPVLTDEVGAAGHALDAHRRQLMLDRWEGLTKTYNRVHNPKEHSDDIARLRELHAELDHAVAQAYGWADLDLDHGFHDTRQGVRFTIGPAARVEVLDRLLELNHDRYRAEVERGLHTPKKGHAAQLTLGGL